jgi:GR25 family glycosyltransferase involved in LPS biosynthesis
MITGWEYLPETKVIPKDCISTMRIQNLPLILWINLDRSVRRRNNMMKLLEDHGLENQRISGVDGLGRDKTQLFQLCETSLNLNPAENACTCSHLLALKHFLKSDRQTVLIFEDDVSFAFSTMIPFQWEDLMNHLPTNWQVIQLAVTTESGSPPNHLARITPESKHYCSSAYLINRSGAEWLTERYWLNEKIMLSDKDHATSDSMISSVPFAYSIPIFSYETFDSTIHPNHLYIHNRAKYHQYLSWEIFHIEYQKAVSENRQEKFLNEYFRQFAN